MDSFKRKKKIGVRCTLREAIELSCSQRFDNKNNYCLIQEPKLKMVSLKSQENFKSRSKSSLYGLPSRMQIRDLISNKVCARFREHTTRWRSSLVQTLEKHFCRLSGILQKWYFYQSENNRHFLYHKRKLEVVTQLKIGTDNSLLGAYL